MADEKGYKRETGSMYTYANGDKLFVAWANRSSGESQKAPVYIELASVGKSKIYATKNLIRLELSLPRCSFMMIPSKLIRATNQLIRELGKSNKAKKLYEAGMDTEEDTPGEVEPKAEEKEEEFDPEFDRFG